MKTIRKATPADIPHILRIFAAAKATMRATGNHSQWTGPYPGADAALADIERGWCHIIEHRGHPAGTFCLMDTPEPTYTGSPDCVWPSDAPYVTLHRVASDGTCRGILALAVTCAAATGLDIRVDTHADNTPMRRALPALGFRHCGTIYLADGSPRLAYIRIAGTPQQ